MRSRRLEWRHRQLDNNDPNFPRDKLKLKLGSDAALAPTNRSLKPVHEFTHAYLRRKWEDEHHVALTRLVKAYENAGQEIDWEEVGSQIGRSATAAISKWKRLEHTKTVPRVPGSKKRPRGVSSSSSSLSAAGAALSGLSLPSNASSGPMSPSSGASRKTSGKRAQARQTTLKETRRTIKLTTSDQETGSAPTASKGVKCRSEAQTPGAEADEREPKLIAIKEDTPVSSVEVFVERKAVHAPFEPAGASSFKEPLVRTSAPTSSLHIAPSFRPWTPSEDFSLVYSVILCGEQSWDVVMNERAPETQHHPPYASDQGRSLPSLRECGRSVDEVVSRWFSNWRTRVAEHGGE
ncbi:BQ2448_7547 [Microbotryum intermedium]|uniref:BQ2448_7547 protein n=1 Tax=Microbotryum intermedium TaxID=269621 RepID=A0A238FTG5_9BASI|nr:BQ2448_7547 [Microbotryum intermedium]